MTVRFPPTVLSTGIHETSMEVALVAVAVTFSGAGGTKMNFS